MTLDLFKFNNFMRPVYLATMDTKITLGSVINIDLSIFDHPIITILKKIEGYDPRFQLRSYLYFDGNFILLS